MEFTPIMHEALAVVRHHHQQLHDHVADIEHNRADPNPNKKYRLTRAIDQSYELGGPEQFHGYFTPSRQQAVNDTLRAYDEASMRYMPTRGNRARGQRK